MHYLAKGNFLRTNMSYNTLMYEMQPVVLQSKRFDSREKSINFALSRFFDRSTFRCTKRLQKKLSWVLLYIGEIVEKDLEFVYHDNSYRHTTISFFRVSTLRCQELNASFDISICFLRKQIN